MQLFLTKARKLWNGCNIRVMISLSLILQIILIIFGSRRKYTKGILIRIIVWSAYVAADWVAIVTLGMLTPADNQGNSEDNHISKTRDADELHAFWAPFLLMHLGGPDTITAYSLEDNELWLRHFLGFIVQVGLALYVIILSWSNTILTFLAIPVLVTGIIKYGERTWILRSSSSKQLKESLLPPPDAGTDVFESKSRAMVPTEAKVIPIKDSKLPKPKSLMEVYFLFERFIYLFSDLILGYYERTDGYSIIHKKSPKEAFNIVSIELGFLYDILHTKATAIYSPWGIIFRCINFVSSTCVLVVFSIIIDMHAYSAIDVAITYLLLVWAIVLEVYSLILLLFSDWTRLWLSKLKTEKSKSCKCDTSSSDFIPTESKKWSGSMAQYNLIKFCLKGNTPAFKCIAVRIYELFGKYQDLTWKDVNDDDLQEIIFTQLQEKGKQIEGKNFKIELCKKLLAQRGDHALEKNGCLELDRFLWSTTEVEFDHSLLLWHITTDICFYDDSDSHKYKNREISKHLSDYMLYLLIFCPKMLPKGIGEIRDRDTCEEAKRFFKQKKDEISNKRVELACKALLDAKLRDDSLEEIKGDKCQSVFFYARRLAKQLQNLESHDGWSREKKWRVISEVWVELLMYAANNCAWKEHGQQLRKGGELLTHVRLLMVHLGLSEQYQIQKKYILSPESWLDRIVRKIKSVLEHPYCKCFLCHDPKDAKPMST